MKQELTTNSRPLTHSEHSMDYILKKSETIKSLFEDCETRIKKSGSKYSFLEGNSLNRIMSLVEDIDRCVCAMNSVDMSMHRMYVLLSLYHYREKLNELYWDVHGRYQETQYYILSCIDDKDKSDFYCRCNKYWQERLQYVPDAEAIKKKLDILTIEKRLDSFDRHAMMMTDSIYTAIITALLYEINHTKERFEEYKQDSTTATVECAMAYCRTFWDIEEVRLIKQANRDRYKRVLDEDDWCDLRHTEEKIIDYIIGESTDLDFDLIVNEYYDDNIRDNRELIEQFKKCLPTDKLFNIKEAFEKNHKLAVSLKYDNIYLFYRMVLRFNIMQCHIYPELKPELDAWKNGEEHKKEVINIEQKKTKDGEIYENSTEDKPHIDTKNNLKREHFCYIHPTIVDDETKYKIDSEIEHLVKSFSVPEICEYLKNMDKKNRLFLPKEPGKVMEELRRFGMPNESKKGFSPKNFSKYYNINH